MMFNSTTYQEAAEHGEITQQILVYPSQQFFIDKSGLCSVKTQAHTQKHDTTHFPDIFGNFHYFFRSYTYSTMECKVRILPYAYCYTNSEIIWTKSRKILVSYTLRRHHPMEHIRTSTKYKYFISLCRSIQKWLKFYLDSFFVKKISASVALLSRHEASETYGHFIRDIIGSFYQLKLANITPDFYILPLNTPFQAQMYELLGIPQERLIPYSPNILIQAKQLIIPTLMADYEIVEYRKHLHYRSFLMPLFTYQMYDDLLPNDIIPERKIFLVRPHNSNRRIENQTEVEYIFKDLGYEIILPDNMSVKEQIHTFASATHIASMHGSALVNIAFCKKNTRIFEIFPQYYHDPAQCYMALARGCKYSYMVGETHDISMHPQQENVYVNPEKLKLALQIFEQE